ncbi:DUF4091 domain-containing protein [Cohnella sp. JJ-181]|uniref:DUF4091 domain-containing protein n=1 Tax=Cohnella rhizoplanae TaxID=2974897 RepID=UPI0022FFBCDA|nr:glycoside hydrolase domain-containing protein [Cohnella sp. JJ-181]CAI6044362.1 hypothetical protein COHCIP112018_01216 [Cohnella sp. JJ-181]
MPIQLGLEHESFKYVFGILHKFSAPFGEPKSISLTCGRNDRAAVQLLIYSDEEMLVSVGADPCFYERGPIEIVRVDVDAPGLKPGAIKANLIGLVEDDDRQLKSDMILPQTSIHVEKRRAQPVWVELELDRDVKPGRYEPRITVYRHTLFEDETPVGELSFEVHVADVTLNDPADHGFYLDLWQHNANIARKYDVELWSDRHFEIIENYVASLSALGQKASTLVVSEIPWSGQSSCYDRIDPANLFEYNIVQVTKRPDGEWHYDFGALNRYVELCMKHRIEQEIEVFGLLNIWMLEDAGYGRVIEALDDAVRIRYFDGASRTYKYMRDKDELAAYVTALERNFIDRGWIDRVRVVADEPADLKRFVGRLNTLKEMAPSFRYKAALDHAEFVELNIEGLTDYVLNLDSVAKEHDRVAELVQNKTGRMLYYVACTHKQPNTFINSHPLESRLIPWLSWFLKMDGFLRWNYTVWPNDPLRRITYHGPFFPAGDTNFVYPGRDGTPMLSLRYKLLQKGIRDFDIMQRYVSGGGDRERLAERLKTVFLWNDLSELHPKSRRTREELFLLEDDACEAIVGGLLAELAGAGQATR